MNVKANLRSHFSTSHCQTSLSRQKSFRRCMDVEMNFEHTAYSFLRNQHTEVGLSPRLGMSDVLPPLWVRPNRVLRDQLALLDRYHNCHPRKLRAWILLPRLLSRCGTATFRGIFHTCPCWVGRHHHQSGPLLLVQPYQYYIVMRVTTIAEWSIVRLENYSGSFQSRIHTRGVCRCMAARIALRNLNWPMQ